MRRQLRYPDNRIACQQSYNRSQESTRQGSPLVQGRKLTSQPALKHKGSIGTLHSLSHTVSLGRSGQVQGGQAHVAVQGDNNDGSSRAPRRTDPWWARTLLVVVCCWQGMSLYKHSRWSNYFASSVLALQGGGLSVEAPGLPVPKLPVRGGMQLCCRDCQASGDSEAPFLKPEPDPLCLLSDRQM